MYNSIDDPSLNEVLATTYVISVNADAYRFDFPSIDTYTSGFVAEDGITSIVNNTFSSRQVANVISFPTEITGEVWGGNLSVSGNFTLDGENVGTT